MSAATLIMKSVGRSGRSALLGGMALAALMSTMVASHAQVTNGTFSTGITGNTALSGSITQIPSWTGSIAGGEAGCVVDSSSGNQGCGNMGNFANPANESGTILNANGTAGNLAAALPYVALMVDPGAQATLSQSITLTAGDTYTLSFLAAMAENEGDATGITWAVSLGGDTLTGIDGSATTTTISVSGNGTTNWVQENYTFTDVGSPETLKFIANGNSGPPIALLDSVTITQTGTGTKSSVPEPATLAVLGFGVAGLYVARRRRAAGNSGQDSGPGDAAAA
jgi:hypothetical protein